MASPTYLAAGFGGIITTSNDGMKWSKGDSLGKDSYNTQAGCMHESGVILCGRESYKSFVSYSRNGRNFEDIDASQFPKTFLAVTYHEGKFVGTGADAVTIGHADAFITDSKDGKKWSSPKSIESQQRPIRSLASGNGLLVGVGDRGVKIASKNLSEWKVAPDQKAIDTLVSVTFGNGVFVGGGLHGLRMISKDGLSWKREEGEEGEHINSVLWTGKEFVGIGQGATYRSANGSAWTRTPNTNAPIDAAYGPGGFAGIRWKGRIVHSRDAITWTEVASFPAHLNKILFALL